MLLLFADMEMYCGWLFWCCLSLLLCAVVVGSYVKLAVLMPVFCMFLCVCWILLVFELLMEVFCVGIAYTVQKRLIPFANLCG